MELTVNQHIPISKDLQSIANIIEAHNKENGLDPVEAMKQTAILTKKIGQQFQHCQVYISYDKKTNNKIKRVNELLKRGCTNHTKISKITGIPRPTVTRYIKLINQSSE